MQAQINEAQEILIDQLMRFVAADIQDPGPRLVAWSLAVSLHSKVLRGAINAYLELPPEVRHDKERLRQAFNLSAEDCEKTDAKIHELSKLHKLGEL